jgi:hypothetical protein
MNSDYSKSTGVNSLNGETDLTNQSPLKGATGTEPLICKKCETIFRMGEGRFVRDNPRWPKIKDVGFKCPGCKNEAVVYSLSEDLRKEAAVLEFVDDKTSNAYKKRLKKYRQEFRRFNARLRSRKPLK